MKKIFAFVLIFALIFSSASPISALSRTEKLSDKEMQRIKSLSNKAVGTSGEQNDFFFGNFFKLFTAIEAPNLRGTGKIKCVDPFFGSSYVVGSSSSNINCDFISVKIKVYKSNGGLDDEKEDSERNATYVGIDTTGNGFLSYSKGTFAYGYHRFRKQSYKDINLETYDEF